MEQLEKIEKELKEVEMYPIWLGCEYYPNPKKTVETHLSVLKASKGSKRREERFKPYYERLCMIYKKMKK